MNNDSHQPTQQAILESEEIIKTDSVDQLLNQLSEEENLENIPELAVQAIEINSSLAPTDNNG